MKTIQILSALAILIQFVGCQVSEDSSLNADLFAFGLLCLFTLIYSSHLIGLQNQNKNGK